MCVSLLYGFYQVQLERRNLRNDLTHRSAALTDDLQDNLESASGHATDKTLARFVERYGQRENLLGLAV